MLDVVLLRETLAQPAMLVNKLTRWCLSLGNVLWPQKARVHAVGAAIHLILMVLSCDGEVLCMEVDGAMRGDSLRASEGRNLCKPLTGLLVPDTLPTATSRKCLISSGVSLALLASWHDLRIRVLKKSLFPLHNCSPGR